MSGSPKGRTELKICGSGPKNCAEHHGNVRFCVAPQKPIKSCEKPQFQYEIWQFSDFLFGEQKSQFFFSAGHASVLALGRGRGAAAARPASGPGDNTTGGVTLL